MTEFALNVVSDAWFIVNSVLTIDKLTFPYYFNARIRRRKKGGKRKKEEKKEEIKVASDSISFYFALLLRSVVLPMW